jgi:hypothetical protein
MLFGATPFANSPFADPGGVSIFVTVNGVRMNFAIGNVVIEGKSVVLPTGQTILLTGEELSLATNPVSVISWNPIPPNVNQIWIPIDPDA